MSAFANQSATTPSSYGLLPDEEAVCIAQRIISQQTAEQGEIPVGFRLRQISDLASALLSRFCQPFASASEHLVDHP